MNAFASNLNFGSYTACTFPVLSAAKTNKMELVSAHTAMKRAPRDKYYSGHHRVIEETDGQRTLGGETAAKRNAHNRLQVYSWGKLEVAAQVRARWKVVCGLCSTVATRHKLVSK